jgi:hypothetical protein
MGLVAWFGFAEVLQQALVVAVVLSKEVRRLLALGEASRF